MQKACWLWLSLQYGLPDHRSWHITFLWLFSQSCERKAGFGVSHGESLARGPVATLARPLARSVSLVKSLNLAPLWNGSKGGAYLPGLLEEKSIKVVYVTPQLQQSLTDRTGSSARAWLPKKLKRHQEKSLGFFSVQHPLGCIPSPLSIPDRKICQYQGAAGPDVRDEAEVWLLILTVSFPAKPSSDASKTKTHQMLCLCI